MCSSDLKALAGFYLDRNTNRFIARRGLGKLGANLAKHGRTAHVATQRNQQPVLSLTDSQAGDGFQTIRNGKTSFWGAPQTIRAVETLAAQTSQAGLPDLYIGEFSRPRGGSEGLEALHQTILGAELPANNLAQWST